MGGAEFGPASRLSKQPCTRFCAMPLKSSESFLLSRRRVSTDGVAAKAGRRRDGGNIQGHQKCSFKCPSSDGQCADFGPCTYEYRYHPNLCNIETGLDQTTTEETPGTGARNSTRVS